MFLSADADGLSFETPVFTSQALKQGLICRRVENVYRYEFGLSNERKLVLFGRTVVHLGNDTTFRNR